MPVQPDDSRGDPTPARPQPRSDEMSEGELHELIFRSAMFAGPLPPPAALKEYNDILPGAAKQVFANWSREAESRRASERKALDAEIEDQRADRREARYGQFFGFGIGIAAILAGSAVAIYTSPTAGATISSIGIVSLVSAFIIGRTSILRSRPTNSPEDPPRTPPGNPR